MKHRRTGSATKKALKQSYSVKENELTLTSGGSEKPSKFNPENLILYEQAPNEWVVLYSGEIIYGPTSKMLATNYLNRMIG